MVKPTIYFSVLRRFLATSRQPRFLNLPEYKGKQEYIERNQEIMLSSCYYKYNWSYNRYKVFLNAMLEGKKYFVCGIPYQIAVMNNLVSKEQLIDEAKESDLIESTWDMEMNCLFYGESDKAYFKYDEISKCRTLKNPIIPFTDQQYIDLKGDPKKLPFYRPKQNGEIRVLCADVALLGGNRNDATQVHLISMIPSGDEYIKNLEYSESSDGGNTEIQAFRIKQMFYDLNADYLVLDVGGNGIGIYDALTKQQIDENRLSLDGSAKIYPAWVAMNNADKASRTIDKDALPVIFSVSVSGLGSGALMHEMYVYLKTQFERKKIKLLIDELNAKEYLIDKYDYLNKSAYEQSKMFLSFLQTSRLIAELTQLESELRGGYIKLTEPVGKRKDRASALFYGMYYVKILEAQFQKQAQKADLSVLFNGNTGQSTNKSTANPFGSARNPFSNRSGNPFGR